ncbi:MAG: DUF1257 domain-containing protein [Synechococcaceae bacterium WB8_1B_136]|nr:DUF1257 domain-containing protein [Synechococcaceae bacterium WB8_1B_136]
MSHLSILPTVLRDASVLTAALEDLGLQVEQGGLLRGFADDQQPVTLQVRFTDGTRLGWARQGNGSLALVGDLQRLGRSHRLQQLLGRITRGYAARLALQQAGERLPDATISLIS